MRNKLTEYSSKFERLRIAICRDCFDAEVDDRHARPVEWSVMSVETPKYHSRERNKRVFVETLMIAFCDFQGLLRR
jgi:hypothetical protein